MKNEVILKGIVEDIYPIIEGSKTERYINVVTKRLNDTCDKLNVKIKSCHNGDKELKVGDYILVQGVVRTENKTTNNKSTLQIYIQGDNWEFCDDEKHFDEVEVEGCLCKSPIFRTTPNGKEITDLLVSNNIKIVNSNGAIIAVSNYIPVIVWGKLARKFKSFMVGDKFTFIGRLQSRDYTKKYPDGTSEDRTAYELSISTVLDESGQVL